ncbi:MAG: glycosyltransferase family 4 protein [Myxococcota bacterium]
MNVLFISKPIAPPFHDGSKCLVRDIATRLERAHAQVLSTRAAQPLTSVNRTPIEMVPIYSNAGRHAPSLTENLRAASWVLTRSHADVWHFVFAPNPRTSSVARWLARGRRKPVVQTIASPPRSFSDVKRLLFGDVVVAQSRWTAERVRAACDAERVRVPELRVIPPPVPTQIIRERGEQLAARASLRIPPDAPLFVYPGDLEVSCGGNVALAIAEGLARCLPEAVVLFAYRRKTEATEVAAEALRARAPSNTRFAASIPDVLSVIASANAVIFPVDDLWGKVDLPIVLLEAMVLGVPVVALGQGPLAELAGAEILASKQPDQWIDVLLKLHSDAEFAAALVAAQRRGSVARSAAENVAREYERIYFELFARRRA